MLMKKLLESLGLAENPSLVSLEQAIDEVVSGRVPEFPIYNRSRDQLIIDHCGNYGRIRIPWAIFFDPETQRDVYAEKSYHLKATEKGVIYTKEREGGLYYTDGHDWYREHRQSFERLG